MIPSLSLLSCELSVSVKESPDRKKDPLILLTPAFPEKIRFFVKNTTFTQSNSMRAVLEIF